VSAGKPEIRLHLLRAHPGRVLRHSSSATGSGAWLHTVTTRSRATCDIRSGRRPRSAVWLTLPRSNGRYAGRDISAAAGDSAGTRRRGSADEYADMVAGELPDVCRGLASDLSDCRGN